MIDLVFDIESFEQKCVVIKVLLWPYQLKKHMVTIVIDQLLSNGAMYEHICLENINKLYKSARKFDDQQQYKSVIEAKIVSIPERFTENSPISPGPYVTVKNNGVIKSLRLFTELFYVKIKLLSNW